MAANETRRVEEDSADSDDSIEGRPDFSAEERVLVDDLLKSSNEFIRLHEEHQPELQQIITQLQVTIDGCLDHLAKASGVSRGGRVAAVAAVAGGVGAAATAAAFFLSPFTAGVSLAAAATVAGTGASHAWTAGAVGGTLTGIAGGYMSYRSNKSTQAEVEDLLEKVKKGLNTFRTTADSVTNHLNLICSLIEKILQNQSEEHSFLLKHEQEGLRKRAGALSELAELFTPEHLQRFLEPEPGTLETAENISPDTSAHLHTFDFSIFKDTKALPDFDRLKKRAAVQEDELESRAGRFIWKVIDMIHHLQNTVDEIMSSRTSVEKVLIPHLSDYCEQ
ncbi:uncharacterized protein [Salminus brasiliensis]|uniref:uncharacterized protein n=1 Tax=Salminus brasiliensis TaxID=930266 RepID=UPI003B832858